MALIHVYDGLNHNTSYTFNGRLRDHIKGVNWENSIILRGGYRVDADYEVQPEDIIYVRKTPAVATKFAIAVIAIATVVSGVIAGVAIYNNKQTENEMEAAQKASKAGAEQTGKLPFVKSARNQAATGQTFPYIIGETLFTPYRLCPAHYTIAGAKGEEQYYNVVLECGYNNLVIDKIKMGETLIKAFKTNTPQNGEYSWDKCTYYDDRNKIEIRQTGDFINADFNEKIVMTELNEEIPHDHASSDPDENVQIEEKWQTGVVQELPSRPMKVELIALFDGLQIYDDGWKSQTITLQPQWTNDPDAASPTWNDFDTGFIQNGTPSNTFEYNTKQQMRYSAVQTFTAEQAYGKKISVRVRRTTPKAESNAKDTVYLMAVQTTCYDAKKSTSSNLVAAKVLEDAERDKCTRLGIRVAANANTSGNLDAFSIITRACARTWNGRAWTSARTPTSNLAAWVLEILTSSKHAPSKYEDSELDLATFGEWYTYCQTQGFRADGVICRPTKKKSIIETLCKNGNAALVFNPMTGKIEVAIDNGRDYSIALLNSDTIQTISTTKEFKRKTTGKKVTYINKDEDYDADSVIFMRDGGDYDPQTDTLTKTALEYITTYQHAFKYAWRQMAEEMAQPRVATVKVGREAAYYPIFSRVELQHQSLKIGLSQGKITGLKWQSGLLKEIYIEGTVTFPANVACGVIINCVSDSGRGLCALKVTGTGTTSTLTVTTTIRQSADIIPRAGDYFSFGKLDNDGNFTTVTNTMKITNAEETDDGYTLTLVDYNAALYTYGTLPEYKSNLTKTPDGSKKTVESQRDYITEADSKADATGAAQEALDLITTGVRFTNIYKLKGMRGIPQTGSLDYNIPAIADTFETLRQELDEIRKEATDGISITDDKITIQVSDSETRSRALIEVTAQNITQLVEDEKNDTISIIEQTAAGITQQVQEIEGNVSTLQQTASGLTTQVESINGDISTINGAIGNINNSITGINGDISDINGTIGTINGDITELSGDVSELKQTASGLTTQVANINTEVVTAQTAADNAQTAADNAQTAADNAQTKADNAQTAADNAQTKADNAQTAADNAQTKADNAQTAADNAQTAADNAQTAADNAQTAADAAAAAVIAITTRVTTVEQTANGLTTQVSEITQNVDTITGDVQNITGDVSTLQQTAKGLRVDVTDLDRETAATFAAMKNELIAMIDEGVKDTRAGMSITADAIVLQVENTEKDLRAEIDITADEILIGVEAMREELTGLIDVQAGAVTALVEGGGASGSMSLSLNLPIMIDATTRAKLVNASTEAKVAAVYALIKDSEYYGIKGNASDQAVKALWDDAIAGNLIASQIILDADQINLAGKTIFTSQKTESLANTAQSNAEATAASQRNEMATKLGYASYGAMVNAASNGQTIIDGGYLRTALIEVDNLLAQNIVLKQQGYIKSHNYAESGGSPTAGFMLDAANNVIKTYGMIAHSATINGVLNMATGSFNGYLKSKEGIATGNHTTLTAQSLDVLFSSINITVSNPYAAANVNFNVCGRFRVRMLTDGRGTYYEIKAYQMWFASSYHGKTDFVIVGQDIDANRDLKIAIFNGKGVSVSPYVRIYTRNNVSEQFKTENTFYTDTWDISIYCDLYY